MIELFGFILIILLILGASDLVVGVSNDAVNFTNSAVGSKVAPIKMILLVSAIGIIIGAVSSSGMMEIARKGIFHPGSFTLAELMYLFLAVMLTDIILLDLYNSMGLPTSSTVSLVFELFGAALVLALWKAGSFEKALTYINSDGAVRIMTGILLSVVIAFFAGMIAQFFFRVLFTFNYEQNMKKFGGLFAGLALTVIVFFILNKGLKKSSLISPEAKEWLATYIWHIITVSMITFSLFFHILVLKKVKILKGVVLIGTGSLAMAFAGNDLVNFIGVPMAGFHTYEFLGSKGATTPGTVLAGEVPTAHYLLMIAAGIMILALVFSKKARTVTNTEVSLSSQKNAVMMYGEASLPARVVVFIIGSIFSGISKLIPPSVKRFINRRMEPAQTESQNGRNSNSVSEHCAFDMLRASVNIVTASVIIMIATGMKLPLSTTYVTFMVAMGSSLSDRAWGRDNAVSRVNGVLTVIGGWFMTAIIASLAAGISITILYHFRIYGVIAMLALVIWLLFTFSRLHRKRDKAYRAKVAAAGTEPAV